MLTSSVHFRYKLNENASAKSMSLEGIRLKQEEFCEPYSKKQEVLNKYIRTKVNPKGVIDFEEYIPAIQKVVKSSKDEFDKELKEYTADELMSMKRPDLVQIATVYEITSVNRRNEFLVKLILEAQQKLFGEKDIPTLAELSLKSGRNRIGSLKKAPVKPTILRW